MKKGKGSEAERDLKRRANNAHSKEWKKTKKEAMEAGDDEDMNAREWF